MTGSPRKPLAWRELVAIVGLIACVAAVVLFLSRKPADQTLTITGGSDAGLRHRFAEMLAEELRGGSVTLQVVPTSGSVDALERVAAGEIDAALVQGGIESTGILQLTPLHTEPLHLLVKPDLLEEASASLTALSGRTLNLSTEGSGTRRLAKVVLEFVGLLDADGQPTDPATTLTGLSYDELLTFGDDAQTRGSPASDAPDAIFAVSSLPSPVVNELVDRLGYRLVPMEFGRAFAIDAIGEPALSPEAAQLSVDRRDVETAIIPAMTYDRSPPHPPRDIETLGLRLLLVCRPDLDDRAATQLLEAVFESRFARVGTSPITPQLLASPPQFPPHQASEQYRRRDEPLLTGDSLGMLDAAINISAPVLGGALFVWTWARGRKRRHRETSVRAYVRAVNAIEREALEIDRAPHTSIHRLVVLQRDLTQMKTEVLERFASGEIREEESMTAFLSLVKDARDYITRLISQEQEQQRTGSDWDNDDAGDSTPESDTTE